MCLGVRFSNTKYEVCGANTIKDMEMSQFLEHLTLTLTLTLTFTLVQLIITLTLTLTFTLVQLNKMHSRTKIKVTGQIFPTLGNIPKVTNFIRVRTSAVSNHLAKSMSKSAHPFCWNFVHKQSRTHTHTQTNCSKNITPP